MAFQRRVSLALLAALVAASCFSVCVNAAADGALQLPEAAPDRSRVVLVHQARKLTYSDDGEVDIITTIMGDVPVGGGYGYYGYGYSAPPPSVDPTPAPGSPPSPGETPAPSEGPTPTGAPTGEPTSTPEQPTSTPQPTLPPVPANRVGLAFRVNFPTPGGANAILNNPSRLANFRNTFRSQVASSFSSAGVTADDILLGAVTGTGARRSLLQSGIAVDYVMVLPNNTPESVLANIRETSTQNAGNVFPAAFLNSFDLGQPTVQMLEMPGTSSPPPRPPPPPPGSAARTPVSVAMVALSFFGSSMLLALLW